MVTAILINKTHFHQRVRPPMHMPNLYKRNKKISEAIIVVKNILADILQQLIKIKTKMSRLYSHLIPSILNTKVMLMLRMVRPTIRVALARDTLQTI